MLGFIQKLKLSDASLIETIYRLKVDEIIFSNYVINLVINLHTWINHVISYKKEQQEFLSYLNKLANDFQRDTIVKFYLLSILKSGNIINPTGTHRI